MITFKPRHLVLAGAFAIGAFALSGTASADTNYKVQSGDTLNKISQEYGVSVSDLATKNNIKNINLIYTGDVLTISSEQAVATQVVPSQPTVSENKVTTQPSEPTQNTSPVNNVSNSDALNALITRESGGNVNATNGQYYGIGQLSPQARAMYGGNSADYNDQLNAMKAYISARYGSAENAWAHSQATGWY